MGRRPEAAAMRRGRAKPGDYNVDKPILSLLLGLTLLGVLVHYHTNRILKLNVGDLGDVPLVSGFYADEADLDYRYRWSKGESEVSFIGAGGAKPVGGSLHVQGARPKEAMSHPVTMTLSVTGAPVRPTVVTLTQSLQDYGFAIQGQSVRVSDAPVLSLSTSTFTPPGDARQLGVKVDAVKLRQDPSGLNLPPAWMLFWPLVFVGGLYGLFAWLPRPRGAPLHAGITILGILLLFVSLLANVLYVAVYLPPVAGIVGAAGLLVSQRHRLWRWPKMVDALGTGELSTIFMVSAMLMYAGLSVWTISQVDWIGHADYAENAVIARSFVQGRGLTVDYIAQFYKQYAGVSHPAETWPLLQPLMIAPFFAIFGPETWAAKLPNLFVMLGLTWAVFWVASRLWDSRVGLLAGLLTLAHPYFFNSVLYPINDLTFTFLFFVLAWLVWRQVSPYGRAGLSPERAPRPRARFRSRRLMMIGVLSGLLVWSKPSGAVMLAGLGIWAAWTWWRVYRPDGMKVPWRGLLLPAGAFALVLSPLIIRNLLAFGAPFFSTESYDAWILRYWNGDQTFWENIYKVYAGGELPHPRWVVGGKFGYENLFDAVGRNFRWVWEKGVLGQPGEGDYVIGLLPLTGAIVGLAAATRRTGSLFGVVGLSLGMYALFVLFYWHFEGRYFQVVVPWLSMLLAWGIFWVWDYLRRALREGVGRKWGLLLLPLAVAGFLWPSVSLVLDQAAHDTQPTGFVTTMEWLKENSTAQDVVMTRDPWELNWYTGRGAVMIPNDDLQTIERIGKQYGVTMLQLGGPIDRVDVERCPGDPTSTGPFPTGSRPALGRLYCGREMVGYKLVFRQGGGTIYRLSK